MVLEGTNGMIQSQKHRQPRTLVVRKDVASILPIFRLSTILTIIIIGSSSFATVNAASKQNVCVDSLSLINNQETLILSSYTYVKNANDDTTDSILDNSATTIDPHSNSTGASNNSTASTEILSDNTIRKYILCPNKVYTIDSITNEQETTSSTRSAGNKKMNSPSQSGLVLTKSNVRIYCGTDGSSMNNCTLLGGQYQIRIFVNDDDSASTTLSSTKLRQPLAIEFHGITFEGATATNVIIETNGPASGSGIIRFYDCIFQKNQNQNLISATYRKTAINRFSLSTNETLTDNNQQHSTGSYDSNAIMSNGANDDNDNVRSILLSTVTKISNQKLEIVISECIFTDNAIGDAADPSNSTDTTIATTSNQGLIKLDKVELEVYNSLFINTQMDSSNVGLGYIIYSKNANIVMFDNCFMGNDNRIAPVVVSDGTKTQIQKISNFNQRQSSSDLPATDCTFISVPKGNNTMTTGEIVDSVNNQSAYNFVQLNPMGYNCVDETSVQCTASTYSSSRRWNKFKLPCIQTLNEINIAERHVSIGDDSNVRTYILCPDTTYEIDSVNQTSVMDENLFARYNQNNLIHIYRSNVHILCGANGNSTNNCTISGGDIQIHVRNDDEQRSAKDLKSMKNILLLGITFTNASLYNTLITVPGGETMIQDCIFQDNNNVASVFAQNIDPDTDLSASDYDTRHMLSGRSVSSYYSDLHIMDDRMKLSPNKGPKVTISSSVFKNNIIGSRSGESSGIITNHNSTVRVVDCTFVNNTDKNIDYEALNHIIGNFYGHLELNGNCFDNNQINVAPVISESFDDAKLPIVSNRNGRQNTHPLTKDDSVHDFACEFVAKYVITEQRKVNSTCIKFEKRSCGSHPDKNQSSSGKDKGIIDEISQQFSIGVMVWTPNFYLFSSLILVALHLL